MPKPAVHTRTIEIPAAAYDELAAYARVAKTTIDAAIGEAIDDFVTVCIPARIGEREATRV